MKILFFGSSKYVLPIIEQVKPSLVITTEYKPQQPVPAYCEINSIPFLSVATLKDEHVQQTIRNLNADVAVLASFGLIIPQTVLDIFPYGIINIHPSLLPLYRGSTPVQTALLNGDTKTGVSIIKLDADMDHGPLLAQQSSSILSTDTADSLYDRLFTEGAMLVKQSLPEYLNNTLTLTPQDHAKATFTKMLSRESGYIDISSPPSSVQFERMIRAYHPWPGVWSKVQMAKGKWQIVKFLPNDMIQVEGKRSMRYKDFFNGYPELRSVFTWLVVPSQ